MLAPENSIYSFIQQTLLGTYQKPGIGIDTIDMNMNKRTPAFTEQHHRAHSYSHLIFTGQRPMNQTRVQLHEKSRGRYSLLILNQKVSLKNSQMALLQ